MPVYLSVDQISKKYKTTQAVDQLSFQVERGRIFAFLGPNGAGKSTSVRMLLGLIKPDSGTIRFQGLDEGVRPPAETVGYLPEERGLYLDRTVLDNLIYLGRLRGMEKHAAHDKACGWLERFDLHDRRNEKVDALSKGNQQKVQLIAAILHDPVVAILDEPFSGLDPINQEKMLEILFELKARGTTILLSAHQMSLVERLADDLLLMSHGRAVLQGPVAEILAQHRQGEAQPNLHDIYIRAVKSAGLPVSTDEEAEHG
ncbi:MAG TPA: ATP-binding cassette domain-containing protein [Xanthomonadales bacterium]|nr:ATP-binding cassette domain-containing protein [Xanthomonadales bacterium]